MPDYENFLYTQFDSVFFEKTRLSIITILYKEEKVSFNKMKEIIGRTDGAIYSHLKKLISSGYIGENREITGNSLHTFYSLTDTGKDIFKKYLVFLESIVKQ